MSADLKVAVIGLDTSHAVEYPRRIVAPDWPADQKVDGLNVISCLRFKTPFTDDSVLAERTAQLEEWGIKVTDDFDEAVEGAEALIISINDGSYHLEYFERCAGLKVPIFLDKPMADTVEAAQKIVTIAEENHTSFFTASCLRVAEELERATDMVKRPTQAFVYGPLGKAKAGSSIVWYGVHAFEMLEATLGLGAETVSVLKDGPGLVAHVCYNDDRRGVVTLTNGIYQYGGVIMDDENASYFNADDTHAHYTRLIHRAAPFFQGGPQPVMINHSMEIMKLLEATQKSYDSGQPVAVD